MNCAEFESRLNDEFDVARAGHAPDLLEHKAQCAACREVWEQFRLLADGIGAWRLAIPDVDLATAVVFALNQTTAAAPYATKIEVARPAIARQRPSRHVSAAGVIAGAAACLIVASLLALLRSGALLTRPAAQDPTRQGDLVTSHDNRQTEDRSAQTSSAHDAGRAPQVAELNASQPDADRAVYYDLAQRAAGAWGQMSLLALPSKPAQNEAASVPPVEGPPAAPSSGWIDEFERELQPVGRSLGNAFDFLWRAGESADG